MSSDAAPLSKLTDRPASIFPCGMIACSDCGADAPAPSGGRARFKCPKCQVFVEARKSARLACLDCNRPLVKR